MIVHYENREKNFEEFYTILNLGTTFRYLQRFYQVTKSTKVKCDKAIHTKVKYFDVAMKKKMFNSETEVNVYWESNKLTEWT